MVWLEVRFMEYVCQEYLLLMMSGSKDQRRGIKDELSIDF